VVERRMVAKTLTDILIILAVALVLTLILTRLRVPPLIGLFAAGALIGPNGLALIGDPERVSALADVGIIFLLFALGLEFSFRKMMSLGRTLLFAGPLQMVSTGCLVGLIVWGLGASGAQATVLGMLTALSSTAVVLKTLDERSETTSPVGRNALGILIFQDVLVVPIMLLLPLLGEGGGGGDRSPVALGLAALGMVILIVVGTKWIVPRVLLEAARTRSPDVFLMAVVGICFAVAALSASLGLSLALGAFLAGLIVSESPYSHQALGYILPFRNLLMSFFFVSVGMLLDSGFLASHWWQVVLGVVGLVILKTLTGAAAVLAVGYPPRIALATGGALAQVGEFSFVLAAVAAGHGLLSSGLQQGLLAVAVLSMAATPGLIWGACRLSTSLTKTELSRPRKAFRCERDLTSPPPAPSEHLLIIGYGINGRNLARAAREIGISYTIVEMNPDTVTRERKAGEPIIYGDATNEAVLKRAGAPRARIAAVLIGDPVATRSIVSCLRSLSPSLHILARTRFVSEVQALHELGANDVVPEEFETSLEIFRRAASHYALPEEQTETLIEAIRADHYQLLRGGLPRSETDAENPPRQAGPVPPR
jgi:CPA2 family monovalent cation:H+ antiporter-2